MRCSDSGGHSEVTPKLSLVHISLGFAKKIESSMEPQRGYREPTSNSGERTSSICVQQDTQPIRNNFHVETSPRIQAHLEEGEAKIPLEHSLTPN